VAAAGAAIVSMIVPTVTTGSAEGSAALDDLVTIVAGGAVGEAIQ